jgi:hypothetical protein
MSIRKIVFALPFALGIACSHSQSQSQSKDHTGAMWTLRGSNSVENNTSDGGPGVATPDQAASKPDATGAQVTTTSAQDQDGTVLAAGSASSAPEGSQTSTGMGSSEPQQGSPMGSGGSSESMGTDKSAEPGSMVSQADSGMMSGHGNDEMVTGKLSKVNAEQITIAPKGGGEAKTLKLVKETVVTVNGKTAKPSQLKQGQNVHASYSEQDGDEIAVKIDVTKSKKHSNHAQHGATSSSGMGSSGSGSAQ